MVTHLEYFFIQINFSHLVSNSMRSYRCYNMSRYILSVRRMKYPFLLLNISQRTSYFITLSIKHINLLVCKLFLHLFILLLIVYPIQALYFEALLLWTNIRNICPKDWEAWSCQTYLQRQRIQFCHKREINGSGGQSISVFVQFYYFLNDKTHFL